MKPPDIRIQCACQVAAESHGKSQAWAPMEPETVPIEGLKPKGRAQLAEVAPGPQPPPE